MAAIRFYRAPTESGRVQPRVLLVTAALLLGAGCTAAGPRDAGNSPLAPDAVATAETGAIDGLVLDTELRPVAEAVLLLSPGARSTGTDLNGRFVFNGLTPGEYALAVSAPGFHPQSRAITIAAEDVLPVRLQLEPLPSLDPHPAVFHQRGHASCFVSYRLPVTANGNVFCGNVYNTAQNKHRIFWPAIPTEGWNASTLEQVWKSTQVAGRGMQGKLYVANCGTEMIFLEGVSPLAGKADGSVIVPWREKAVKDCKADCPEQKCILQTWVGTVPFLLGPSAAVDGGIMLDQPFEQYHTAFYRMAVPEGYKARPDA